MNWPRLLEIIEEEAGKDACCKIEKRARLEMGGKRIMVYSQRQRTVTGQDVHDAAPGRPRIAAKKLGIHEDTAYRKLRKARLIR